MASKTHRIDMTDAEVEALLQKAGTALEPEELEKLRQLVETLKWLTAELGKKGASVKRLQRILFGPKSEKTKDLQKLLAQGAEAAKLLAEHEAKSGESSREDDASSGKTETEGESGRPDKDKPKGHGRRGAEQYTGGEHEHVPHPTLKHKSPCPKCQKGKLALQKRPKVLVRLVGSAPVQAKVWTYDWLRCNSCGAIFTAPLPKAAGPPEKFDESVTSTIGLLRYGFGMPFNRLEKLQESVSIPLPASTQWDLVNRSAAYLEPVFIELIREAATGEIFYNDDTTMRILELIEARKKKPPDEKSKGERTGTFTTGVISTVGERKIALYLTGQNHAGENLEDVLAECAPGRGAVIQMSDGLSRNVPENLPEGLAIIHANCMAHGRRKYVEIADSFPEQCLHVLVELERVYKNEGKCRREKMTPEERLAYHQEKSAPIMDDLEAWLRRQLDEKLVEPNSGFGEATQYMLKRWDRLTRFLTVVGAPIDNNICERALKRAIRHRKNSLFYKTLHGARVGDIYMSLIHTCELNGINPFTYLTRLVCEGERIAGDPRRWLPWNYNAADEPAATPASP
jgi:transposase